MATYNKFDVFSLDLGNGVHNFSSHTLKVMLSNTLPVATNAIKTDITEISAGNGYTAGGTQATLSTWSQTSGTAKLVLNDVVWTATGGSLATFRYAILYNDSPTSPVDPLIAWWDYGSSITPLVGETFTWDADATTGIFTVT